MSTPSGNSRSTELTPHAVDIGRGAVWVLEGFKLFWKEPLMFIGLVIVMILMQVLIGIIPLAGPLVLNFIYPFFIAGFMAGCAAVDNDRPLEVAHLFAGFRDKPGPLVSYTALYFLVVFLLIMMVFIGLTAGFGFKALLANLSLDALSNPEPQQMSLPIAILLVCATLLLTFPVIMIAFFAPPLIMLGNQKVVQAMRLSFVGCIRNILPGVVYMIVVFLASIVAMIPLGLGLFVLIPVLMASIYTAYQDIYV